MNQYKLTTNGVIRNDGAFIPEDTGNRDWQEYLECLTQGNTPEPAFTFAELKIEKVGEIQADFLASLTSGVIVEVGALILTMDAGEEHAVRLKHGIELAELNGLSEMTITDFSNVDHPGISIADARECAIAMGNDFATKRARKNQLRALALEAATEEELEAIIW